MVVVNSRLFCGLVAHRYAAIVLVMIFVLQNFGKVGSFSISKSCFCSGNSRHFMSRSTLTVMQASIDEEQPRQKAIVAVGQMTSTNDRDKNFQVASFLADTAAKRGAVLLCLPECFHFIGLSTRETIEAAESVEDGPSIARYRKLARKFGLWLSLGGFQEIITDEKIATVPGSEERRIYNAHIVIDNFGKIVSNYRKIHMFDVQVPNGPMLMESRFTEPGKELIVVPTPFGKLGLSTCYDIRFPEMYMELVARGAEIILVPSAFTVFTGRSHWEVLLRSRAIETQCYVLAAAQVGQHHENRASYGHSYIVDPWGTILAGAGGEPKDSPRLVTAEIDLGYLRSVRRNLPVRTHRRTDIY